MYYKMPTKQPTIAITGARGFLGSALVEHFSKKGWQVRALVRTPLVSSKNVSFAAYDLAKPIDPEILKGVDYVVHTAYIKQDRQHPHAFSTNVTAAKQLVAAAKKQGVKKCLFMSSMSAHTGAISAYGKQKLAIEKIFSGAGYVSIRSGLIIGNGGLARQTVDFMRSKHVVPLVEGGKQPLQIISISDLVMAIDKLLLSHLSGILTIATPEIYTYKELYQAISKHLAITVIYVPIPFSVLINVIRIINLLPIPMAVNPDNALGLKALHSVDTKPDLQKIGLTLQNLESSLQAIR
jgi:nucleoside-diphosphate-sugar epimerase